MVGCLSVGALDAQAFPRTRPVRVTVLASQRSASRPVQRLLRKGWVSTSAAAAPAAATTVRLLVCRRLCSSAAAAVLRRQPDGYFQRSIYCYWVLSASRRSTAAAALAWHTLRGQIDRPRDSSCTTAGQSIRFHIAFHSLYTSCKKDYRMDGGDTKTLQQSESQRRSVTADAAFDTYTPSPLTCSHTRQQHEQQIIQVAGRLTKSISRLRLSVASRPSSLTKLTLSSTSPKIMFMWLS